MARLTSAIVVGNRTASRELTFTPYADLNALHQPLASKFDIALEGSAGIFFVALLPYLLFSHVTAKTHSIPSGPPDEFELTIRAGTICVKAPSIFYLWQVFLPTMALAGIGSDHLRILPDHEQGWHTDTSKRPGKMVARIKPLLAPFSGFTLEPRGRVQMVRATAYAPSHVLANFKEALEVELADAIPSEADVKVEIHVLPSIFDEQYHLLLVAEATAPAAFLGYEEVYPQSDVFPAEVERMGTDGVIRHLIRVCIRGLWEELRRGDAVDENMEDMLALYMGLADGFSSVVSPSGDCLVPELNVETPAIKDDNYKVDKGSMHRETSWWMVRQFTDVQPGTAEVRGRERVGCHGMGFGVENAG